jgi:hypothetical protein
MKNLFTLITILAATAVYGQTTMNIYQNNGNVLHLPLSSIDSITYTTANLPTLTTTAATSVTGNAAVSGGNITDNGGAEVSARGVAYATTPNPTTANSTSSSGSGSGSFSAYLNGLTPNTTYYARAYATNDGGTAYGNEISFTTDTTTSSLNVIEITDAVLEDVYYHQTSYLYPTKLVFTNLTTVNGYVYFHQTNNIVEVEFPLLESTGRYFYFHGNTLLEKITAPSLNSVVDYLYVTGSTNLQVLDICNLSDIYCDGQEPYYYITNNTPAIDAAQPCFSATLHSTELTTSAITIFSQNTAVVTGTFTSTCGTVHGKACWSASPNPTMNDFTADGTGGQSSFTVNLTGLSPNTTYYVRTFTDGDIYGNEVSFTTLP